MSIFYLHFLHIKPFLRKGFAIQTSQSRLGLIFCCYLDVELALLFLFLFLFFSVLLLLFGRLRVSPALASPSVLALLAFHPLHHSVWYLVTIV